MRIFKSVLLFLLLLIICFISISALAVGQLLRDIPSLSGPVNVVILGKGGEGHEAPDLTDTIAFVQIDNDSAKVSNIFLPRDIWIPAIRAKLNSAYYWDIQKGNLENEILFESIHYVSGIRPEYFVVVNFSFFERFIDLIGGINVDVKEAFVDNRFPIPGYEDKICDDELNLPQYLRKYDCRYQQLSFDSGVQLMNGERALQYIRSRHSDSQGQGTDNARIARQQQVLLAVFSKLISPQIVLDPEKVVKLYQFTVSNIETNFDKKTILAILLRTLRYGYEMTNLQIKEEFLVVSNGSPLFDYQYVFLPASRNWLEFQDWLSTNLPN